MKHCYETHSFRAESLALIDHAQTIIAEYQAQGYDLTLRQLYYQFVARALLANTERNYKRLGDIVSKGRLAGKLDWLSIVDRTRELRRVSHWRNTGDIVQTCAEQFALDTRADQANYIEVWVEKEALAGIVVPTCEDLDLHSLVCRGYVSQSAMWTAAMRFAKEQKRERRILLHLGDHDPSGIDMTRDIDARLNIIFGAGVEVIRIALTEEQVEKYQPPPNPAKVTDSRYGDYVSRFGEESWELDAIDPPNLVSLIRREVSKYTSKSRRQKLLARQGWSREQLASIAGLLIEKPDWTPNGEQDDE